MLLNLIDKKWPLDIVVFYNTGMEFDCIYAIRDKVCELLLEHGISFVELHPPEPFMYSMLERKIKYKRQDGFHYGYGWCGGPCRWGTKFKINAIQKFKKSLCDTVVDYVGIAADEPSRFTKARQEGKVLPLVEWGMTEADCLEYCHKYGFYWIERVANAGVIYMDIYDLLDRVSCWCCCNKNLKELRHIYNHLPQYWEMLKILQKEIDRPFKGYYKGQPVGIFELEKRFITEEENEVTR